MFLPHEYLKWLNALILLVKSSRSPHVDSKSKDLSALETKSYLSWEVLGLRFAYGEDLINSLRG